MPEQLARAKRLPLCARRNGWTEVMSDASELCLLQLEPVIARSKRRYPDDLPTSRFVGFCSMCFAACVLIFTFAIPTLAQYTNGAISGIVYDPGGAVVTGAPVTIQNQATGYSKPTRPAADGAFLFPATRSEERRVGE